MSNHTDGPWKSIATDDKVHVVGGNNGDLLVMLYRNPTHQQMANARMIAAAPELLDALKLILPLAEAYDGSDAPECVKARAAIAKADGAQ